MNKSKILSYLRNKKTELYELYGINSLGLYGSYAREEAKEDSDIDIFYTTNSKFSMGIFEFTQLVNKLEKDLNAKVDFVNLNFMNPIIKYYAQKDFTYV